MIESKACDWCKYLNEADLGLDVGVDGDVLVLVALGVELAAAEPVRGHG